MSKSLRFDDQTTWVELVDGRVLGVPLAWFPRLLRARPAERDGYHISRSGQGLHREALDEDISVPGLLEERGIMAVRRPVVAWCVTADGLAQAGVTVSFRPRARTTVSPVLISGWPAADSAF
jgi:hypothetical protein